MLSRINRYQFFLTLTVCAVPTAACCLAAVAVLCTRGSAAINATYLYLWLATTLIWSLAAVNYQLCDVDQLLQEYTGSIRPMKACLLTFAAIGSMLFLLRDRDVSRLFVVSSAGFLLLMTIVLRVVSRIAIMRLSARDRPLRVLVIGTDRYAYRASRKLAAAPFVRSKSVAYVRLPEQAVSVRGAKIYEASEIDEIDPSLVDDIAIALPPHLFGSVPELMPSLKRLCRPIRAIIDLGGALHVQTKILDVGRVQVIDLGSMPVESIQYVLLKRTFDIIFSLVAIAATLPLMFAIALAIKLSSKGPILFQQDRIGMNGIVFRMLKFRSMYVNQNSSSSHTKDGDPRITLVGHFLRKTSLDELPQFFNVLWGDMSVVGPRPELTFFVRKFRNEIPSYMARHTIKCGITGLAQVNGLRGSNTSIAKRVQYDLEYVRNWSLFLDLKIILQTVMTGFGAKNAF